MFLIRIISDCRIPETDQGSKKSTKITENFPENQQLTRMSYIFSKISNFSLTVINIYLLTKQIIVWRNKFLQKKKSKKGGIFWILGRIRIHIKMKQIQNTGFGCAMYMQLTLGSSKWNNNLLSSSSSNRNCYLSIKLQHFTYIYEV